SCAYFLYESAGIPGTLLCGCMSDKVFRGTRGATGVFFMTVMTIAPVIYWMNPSGSPPVDVIRLMVTGFMMTRLSVLEGVCAVG
ncbi:glycerol-3-phosphate transporter, partial [Escherichia coli]